MTFRTIPKEYDLEMYNYHLSTSLAKLLIKKGILTDDELTEQMDEIANEKKEGRTNSS